MFAAEYQAEKIPMEHIEIDGKQKQSIGKEFHDHET